MTEAPADAQLARLRWRCRRGTRELDVLFSWWLDTRYPSAASAVRADFDALLDTPDPVLWDWLIGHAAPADPRFAVIVDEIRARHRV